MQEKRFAIMLDAVFDFEDTLQRMALLCLETGEVDAASAASTAAAGVLALGQLMIRQGSTLPVPDDVAC